MARFVFRIAMKRNRSWNILGYRIQPNCGEPGTSLQTADSERAFLTIDSGFPLPELELTLQGGKPFEYAYAASPVPVLFAASDWTMASRKNHQEASKDLIDTILSDPALARLYWALSKLDPETVYGFAAIDWDQETAALCRDPRLLREPTSAFARGGSSFPGGPQAEPAWKDVVGVSPASPAAFVQKLLASDKGWLSRLFRCAFKRE